MSQLEKNRQTVLAFYTRAFNDHEPADAVARYVGSQYIQHNPDTPDGPDAFVKSTLDFIARSPGVRVDIKRVIAEGDFVAAHNLVTTSRPPLTRAVWPGSIFSAWRTAKSLSIGMRASRFPKKWQTATACFNA